MDKYLTNFTAQLDAAFDTETLFRDRRNDIIGWFKQKFHNKRTVIKTRQVLTVGMNPPTVDFSQLHLYGG
jgi:hypothetical protein